MAATTLSVVAIVLPAGSNPSRNITESAENNELVETPRFKMRRREGDSTPPDPPCPLVLSSTKLQQRHRRMRMGRWEREMLSGVGSVYNYAVTSSKPRSTHPCVYSSVSQGGRPPLFLRSSCTLGVLWRPPSLPLPFPPPPPPPPPPPLRRSMK